MYEFLVLLNVFMLGWIACRFYMAYKLRNALKKIAEQNGLTIEELGENLFEMQGINAKTIRVPNLFTEYNNNSILLYNKDTGNFVAQAQTMQELAEHVYKFNKINFALVNHDDKQVWFVEGEVKDNLKEIE